MNKLWKKQENSQDEITVLLGNHLADIIRDIYYEKREATYNAGTLVFERHNTLVLCNLSDEYSEDYKFWLAMCYLKYKSSTSKFYSTSLNIVKNYFDKALVARLLMELNFE